MRTFKQLNIALAKRQIPLLLILILTTLSVNAQGGMLYEIPLENQLNAGQLVVEGEVVSQKSSWNTTRDNIYTLSTIRIHSIFKGETANTLDIITKGGIVEGVKQTIIPNLKLSIGESGVFILTENTNSSHLVPNTASNNKKYNVYSSLQGFYRYDAITDGFSNPFSKTQIASQSFYATISGITQQTAIHLGKAQTASLKVQQKRKAVFLPPENITFSPTAISAGTSSRLTLSGSGFGDTRGSVGFRDADSGGVNREDGTPNYTNALSSQIISWTDNSIVVEVPSTAGTGDIRIINADGTIGVSSQDLVVTYAIINDSRGRRTQHVSTNNTGNIRWSFNNEFDADAPARSAFLRAFNNWRCQTRINWVFSATPTQIARIAVDNISVVAFDTEDPLPEGVLGATSSITAFCNDQTVPVTEIDILFSSDLNNPSTPAQESWYFGENPNGITFFQWDFESVALHELGHAHQLDHVIDTDDAMHFAISNFEILRDLNASNITAATSVQALGRDNFACSFTRMTDFEDSCVLSTASETLFNQNIFVFPNPANSTLFVKNNSTQQLKTIEIRDLSGKLVRSLALTDKFSADTAINVENIASGLYLLKLTGNTKSSTLKIIIE